MGRLLRTRPLPGASLTGGATLAYAPNLTSEADGVDLVAVGSPGAAPSDR